MEGDHCDSVTNKLKLVAQTSACEGLVGSEISHGRYDYFRSVEWSPDGTCVIANLGSNSIQTIIVPPNLLDQRDQPLELTPYSTINSKEPADALACYPGYDLGDTSTTLILSAINEHPIRLNSTTSGHLVASYPLVSPTTEAFIKPHSMIFTTDGQHFIAGSQSLLSTFDVSRSGNGPLWSVRTGPKKGKGTWSNPGLSMRGIVSALAIDTQYNVLAAGTLSRHIGLYDSPRQGECVATFSVIGTDADKAISGNGPTQLAWSRCGRYLYVAERKSSGAMVYDIRKSGQLLCWVTGRAAATNQRMKVDLTPRGSEGVQDLWAGGCDGKVRRWIEPHLHEGPVQPCESLHIHNDVVHSVDMHQTADVLVTAAGQRSVGDLPGSRDSMLRNPSSRDSALKIWQNLLATD